MITKRTNGVIIYMDRVEARQLMSRLGHGGLMGELREQIAEAAGWPDREHEEWKVAQILLKQKGAQK